MIILGRHGLFRPLLGGLFLLSLLVWALGSASSAQAQARDGQVFQDWGIRCIKDPKNPQKQFCTAQHAAINNQTKKTVLAINVGFPPDGSPARAVIMVPLVVLLQPGLKVQVDAGEPMILPFETCQPNGCEVQVELDHALLSRFTQGTGGKVTVQVPPGNEFSVPFSLKGFASALKALK